MARFPMNSPDEYGRDALHYAAGDGDLDWMQERLTAGIDVNMADNSTWRPIHAAIQQGRADALQLLLDHGAQLHPSPLRGGESCLHLAASNWRQSPTGDVIRILLNAGADKNAHNVHHMTPADIVRYMYESPTELVTLLEP